MLRMCTVSAVIVVDISFFRGLGYQQAGVTDFHCHRWCYATRSIMHVGCLRLVTGAL